VWQIALADVPMSLDNVLAVAGVANSAKDSSLVLFVGLAVSVVPPRHARQRDDALGCAAGQAQRVELLTASRDTIGFQSR
jgi:hypothetical protein